MSNRTPTGAIVVSLAVEDSALSDRIAAALQQLDDLSRSAIVLRYYENLSSREIGQLIGLSPAAVDMRLMRARQQLKELLGDDQPPTDSTDKGSVGVRML